VNEIWVPIAIALFGNGVAIAIVLLSNAQAAKMERTRQDREDERLEKSRHDLRVTSAMERRRYMQEAQKQYYLQLHQELKAAARVVHEAGYQIGPPLEFLWNVPAFDALNRLEVYASPETYDAAHEAYSALWEWGDSGQGGYESPQEIEYDRALAKYLIAIRHDLGVEVDEGRLSADDVIR
jgi:hypothetical protein